MSLYHQRDKHFYTILFLDDYFPKRETPKEFEYQVELPKIVNFNITKDTDTEDIKWLNENTLYVRHGLQMPLTLEMWNDDGKSVFYVPLLKEGIDSISVGQVVIESKYAITLYFNEENPPPAEGETFKLALKTLPAFDTTSDRVVKNDSDVKKINRVFEELVDCDKSGLAIVFRRHNLDAHFDLELEFDKMYLHSLEESYDLRFLNDRSKFKRVKWLSLYTDNLQDVVDQINTKLYEVKFSWEGRTAVSDDPYGYQVKLGHLYPFDCPCNHPYPR